MQIKVLIAFVDPGGGLAVSSLIDRLSEEKNLSMEIYSGKLSEKFLKETKIIYNKLLPEITQKEAMTIIDKVKPSVIVTGTSGGNAEQMLRNVAYERKIPSVVILDFWKDYSRRWLYASYPFEEMKDKICVMDEMTKKEMMSENFSEGNLIITGHPYLDKIFNFNNDKTYDNSKIPENIITHNYLFLSQPLQIIGIENYEVHPVKILTDALTRLSEIRKNKITLTIKLHPSEEMTNELFKLSNIHNRDTFEIIFADKTKSLPELINKSKAVIGYNTIAMFEARAAGKRTISLNFASVKDSLMKAMDEAGIEIISGATEEIFNCLNKETKSAVNNEIFKGGIENCMKVILEQLN